MDSLERSNLMFIIILLKDFEYKYEQKFFIYSQFLIAILSLI